jgi:hypothetical protein
MTSIEREEGRVKREESVWDQTVGAVVTGFEEAFGVTARLSEFCDQIS